MLNSAIRGRNYRRILDTRSVDAGELSAVAVTVATTESTKAPEIADASADRRIEELISDYLRERRLGRNGIVACSSAERASQPKLSDQMLFASIILSCYSGIFPFLL
jgi:hypothetical protein